MGRDIISNYSFSSKKFTSHAGGGQGIGRAFCHALGEAGAAVAVVDINAGTAEQVAKELAEKGIRAISLAAGRHPGEGLPAVRLSIPYDLILCIRLRARSLWPACGLVWRTFNAISARSGYGRSPLALVQVSSGVPARGFNSVGSYLGCKTTKLLCVPVWRSMVDTVVQQLGRLDIAVNNAGLNRNAAAEDTPEADWDMNLRAQHQGPLPVLPGGP